jgi:hypothetical protein
MPLAASRPFELAEAMLDAIVDAYAAAGVSLPEKQYVGVGVEVDDCPEVSVRISTITPSELDPAVDVSDPIQVSVGFSSQTATYNVIVMRCAEAQLRMRNKKPELPSITELQDDASTVYADMIRVHNALVDAQQAGMLSFCNGLVFVGVLPLGPSGGHIGSSTTVKAALT